MYVDACSKQWISTNYGGKQLYTVKHAYKEVPGMDSFASLQALFAINPLSVQYIFKVKGNEYHFTISINSL